MFSPTLPQSIVKSDCIVAAQARRQKVIDVSQQNNWCKLQNVTEKACDEKQEGGFFLTGVHLKPLIRLRTHGHYMIEANACNNQCRGGGDDASTMMIHHGQRECYSSSKELVSNKLIDATKNCERLCDVMDRTLTTKG